MTIIKVSESLWNKSLMSNIEQKKEYKNSREKFFLLLREIISNSIHFVLISKSK